MKEFSSELHEQYATEMCLRMAFMKFKEGDIDLAIHRTEDALRSLKALQEIKKANWHSNVSRRTLKLSRNNIIAQIRSLGSYQSVQEPLNNFLLTSWLLVPWTPWWDSRPSIKERRIRMLTLAEKGQIVLYFAPVLAFVLGTMWQYATWQLEQGDKEWRSHSASTAVNVGKTSFPVRLFTSLG